MDFFDVINSRKSIRSYSKKEIAREKLQKILSAAGRGPSWQNQQCVRFLIVTSEEAKKNLVACSPDWNKKALSEAPAAVVACALPPESGAVDDQKYYMADAAIAMQNLVLAATAEGLATCWQAPRAEKEMRKAFNIPEEYRVVAVTPIGYGNEEPERTERIPLDEMAFENEWGKSF